MMGCKRLPYCISTFACIALSRNAPPVAETLNPSCCAILCNSAFTTGLTHKVRCTVFRLGVGLFCEREGLLFIDCGRITFLRGAGCAEAMRSRFDAPLSCLTPRRGCCTFGEYDC